MWVACGDDGGTDGAIFTSFDGTYWLDQGPFSSAFLYALGTNPDTTWIAGGEPDLTDAYLLKTTK